LISIINHRLANTIPFHPSPNIGGTLHEPQIIVMHYTAGGTLASAVNWFASPASGVSAHLVIDRDGTIVQMVDFDRIAYHAGKSSWNGRQGCNNFSIGIELVNWGILQSVGDTLQTWTGSPIKLEDAEYAALPGGRSAWWHKFTDTQINVAYDVCALLVREYGLVDIVGHCDVAPGRKVDPGALFPMQRFKGLVNAHR